MTPPADYQAIIREAVRKRAVEFYQQMINEVVREGITVERGAGNKEVTLIIGGMAAQIIALLEAVNEEDDEKG